jgi:hypothetical protein
MKKVILMLAVCFSTAPAMVTKTRLEYLPLVKSLKVYFEQKNGPSSSDYNITIPIRPSVMECKKFSKEKILGLVQDEQDNVIIPLVATVKDENDLLILVKIDGATQQAKRFYIRNVACAVDTVQIKQKLAHGPRYIAKFSPSCPYRKVMIKGVIDKASCTINGVEK